LVRFGKSNRLFTPVEVSVPSSDEDVTKNQSVSELGGEGKTLDTQKAFTFNREDVIAGRNFEAGGSESEGQSGVRVNVSTVELAGELSSDLANPFSGTNDQRSTGIDNSLHVVFVVAVASELDTIEGDDPVSVLQQGEIFEVRGVQRWVNTSQDKGGSVASGSSGKEEGERGVN